MRALRLAAAAWALAAASPTPAFVRTTTVDGQPGQGDCLWWGTRQVTYQVNATSAATSPCLDAAAAARLTAASFPTWSPSCTDFRFVNGGTTTATSLDGRDGVNLVVFRSGLCADLGCTGNACATANDCWDHGAVGTLAITTVTYYTATGEIVDADMELYGWNGRSGGASGTPRGYYYTCAGPGFPTCARPPYGRAGCNDVDVGSVVTHEAGHMLGLDHTCHYPAPFDSCPDTRPSSSSTPTMNPAMASGDLWARDLAPDDVNGVCSVYPSGAATATTCAASGGGGGGNGGGGGGGSTSSAASGSGCGTGGGGGAALLIALAALARALRPRVTGAATSRRP